MAYSNWLNADRWIVTEVKEDEVTEMAVGDLLTFVGTGVPADSTVTRKHIAVVFSWGTKCQHHNAETVPEVVPEYVHLKQRKSDADYYITYTPATGTDKAYLQGFAGIKPAFGGPTGAVWTAEDQ